jgi:CheY-like chemotaxis protein
MLSVRDTGTGIAPEHLPHIFEPFFTTKEPGRGTGLGLASAYGIINQSHGFIGVDTTAGRGSAFHILLPATQAGPGPTDASEPERRAGTRGSETVLVVEDEPMVRAITVRGLEEQGYRVLQAQDGVEALQVADLHAGPIDLLVSDVVMPRMSGEALAAALVARRPALKVLFVSGYPDRAFDDRDEGHEADLLMKPFMISELTDRVRSLLDRPKR